ncbi:MAG: amidohydrolase family protein [Planctomycetaceae bacterium]
MTSLRPIPACCLLVLFTASTVDAVANDEIPGAPQNRRIALINAVVHPITAAPVAGCTLIFEDGIITAIGQTLDVASDTEVIDVQGQHVYPSLIEAMSQIGLREISAVRATRDDSEVGSVNPNVKAQIAFNPDSEVIPVTRANGVLIAGTAPAGGRVSGYASVMQLDGWTYEQMTLKPNAALVVNWPSPPSKGESPGLKELRRLIQDARAYAAARDAEGGDQRFDIRLDSLRPVLAGDVPVLAKADELREIQAAVAFAVEQQLKLIIFGGYDAEKCADLLVRHNVPVIIDSVHRRPVRRHEPYDHPYTLPMRLRKKGVLFCISGYGRENTWNARNLPYHAATASAHGLTADDALRSVTLDAAKILGIDDQVGSLDVGKQATLIITTGNPLSTDTQVTHAFVQGRTVQLTSRHTRLHDKYRQKYQQLKP